MECWTICETATRGITIATNDPNKDPVLCVGEPNHGDEIPVSADLRELFERRRERIIQVKDLVEQLLVQDKDSYNKADAELRRLLWPDLAAFCGESPNHPPKDWDYSDQAVAWCKESALSARLTSVTLEREPLKLMRLMDQSDCALVHITTLAPIDGQMWYEANTWTEEIVETNRGEEVERTYGEFPSVGVEVLARGHGPQGEPHGLFLMRKKASFRIVRKGDPSTFDDDPNGPQRSPVLVVVWPGSTLRCFPPARYASREKRVA
jgi:hypothetical protein